MISVMTDNHNRVLKTAKDQPHERNTLKPKTVLYTSIAPKKEPDLKSVKPTSDLRIEKSSWVAQHTLGEIATENGT